MPTTKTPTLYLSFIEEEEHIGVIVSPTLIDVLDGLDIDTECLIIWHYMGNKVPNNDSILQHAFMDWISNIYQRAGINTVKEL